MPQLTEANRLKLDDIVQQMSANGEPDDAIRFVVSDFKTKYGLPDRPVSAEDFTDPTAGIQAPTLGGYLRKTLGSAANLVKGFVDTGMDTRPEDVALGPMAAAAPYVRSALSGAGNEARKAMNAPTTSEAIGHVAAAALPLVGPAAAAAGERFGSGDVEGGFADTTTLLAPMATAKVAPRVAPSLATIGEQIAAKGKVVAPYALDMATDIPVVRKPLSRYLKTKADAAAAAEKAATEAAAQKAAAEVEAARIAKLRQTTRLADTPEAFTARGGAHKTAAPPTLVSSNQALADALSEVNAPMQPESIELPPPPDLPPGYEPRTTVPAPKSAQEVGALARDAAGTPVKAPTLAQMLADSLAEATQPEPPARVTTAPEPSLPPGYTPRVSAKLPKQVAERIAARGSHGPRNYFLKTDAAQPARTATPANVDVADLPVSWRGRTGPEPITPRGMVGQQDAAEAAQILRERGMSIGEAVMRVAKNKDLPTAIRLQLIDAIKKSARIPAEVR